MKEQKRRGPLGCLLVLVGIGALLTALGYGAYFGLSWLHFTNTPDFETYLTSSPVDVGVLDEKTARGEVLAEQRSWRLGEVDPWEVSHQDPDHEHVSLTLDIDLEHGDTSLLRLRQRFLFVLANEDGERRGFRIETPQLETHPDMRALVVVHLGDVDHLVGAGSQGRGWANVDVFLAAGAGKSTVRILRAAGERITREDRLAELGLPSRSEPDSGRDRYAGLLTHVLGSPPVIGLVHHVRQPLSFAWKPGEDALQGGSDVEPSHFMTTKEYSYELTFTVEEGRRGERKTWSSSSFSSTHTWNDEVW